MATVKNMYGPLMRRWGFYPSAHYGDDWKRGAYFVTDDGWNWSVIGPKIKTPVDVKVVQEYDENSQTAILGPLQMPGDTESKYWLLAPGAAKTAKSSTGPWTPYLLPSGQYGTTKTDPGDWVDLKPPMVDENLADGVYTVGVDFNGVADPAWGPTWSAGGGGNGQARLLMAWPNTGVANQQFRFTKVEEPNVYTIEFDPYFVAGYCPGDASWSRAQDGYRPFFLTLSPGHDNNITLERFVDVNPDMKRWLVFKVGDGPSVIIRSRANNKFCHNGIFWLGSFGWPSVWHEGWRGATEYTWVGVSTDDARLAHRFRLTPLLPTQFDSRTAAEKDRQITAYCSSANGIKDKRCGCALPQQFYAGTKNIGPPHCIDNRCMLESSAWRLKYQEQPCSIVNCSAGNINLSDANVNKAVVQQNCSANFTQTTNGTTMTASKAAEGIVGKTKDRTPTDDGSNIILYAIGGLTAFILMILIMLL